MPAYRIANQTILYFHIPKAGGTSIEKWLAELTQPSLYQSRRSADMPCVPQHFHGALIEHLFGSEFFDYSFCVTRNPYARLLSEYNYRVTIPRLKNKLLPRPSLHRWLRRALSRYASDQFVFSNHIRPQHEFMLERTEYFRLEDGLHPLRDRLMDVTGQELPDTFPRKNVSRKIATELSEQDAAVIRKFYQRDFEIFGYDPDSWRGISDPTST